METIRDLRKARGLSQAALAREAGISTQMVSAVERGRKRPSLVTLRRIADALRVPVAALI